MAINPERAIAALGAIPAFQAPNQTPEPTPEPTPQPPRQPPRQQPRRFPPYSNRQETDAENDTQPLPAMQAPDPTATYTPTSDYPSRATAIRERLRHTWEPSGNAEEVAKVLAGFLVVLGGFVAWSARRRNIQYRRPTAYEGDSIALPIAGILCRHFPMASLGPDMADGLSTVGAVMAYVDNGPLFWTETPPLEIPEGINNVP